MKKVKKIKRKGSEIKKYKQYVSLRLEKLVPIFQRIAAGDFSTSVDIPKKEDEFTPLVAALSMVLDDLKFLDKDNKEKNKELEKRKTELEKRVAERTKELQLLTENLEEKVKQRTQELAEKVEELEKFQKISIGRELKMIELKNQIQILEQELGKYRTSQNN